jgi:RNA polymerase sigma factor for flagellar operon FliA
MTHPTRFTTERQRTDLILKNLPRARSIASRIYSCRLPGVSLEDLISAGVLGLIVAVDRYDPAFGQDFQVYAEQWIREAIFGSVRGLGGVSPQDRRRLQRINRAVRTLQHSLGRSPDTEEIAAELGISVALYHAWRMDIRGASVGSLDAPMEESQYARLAYLVPDRHRQPESLLGEIELIDLVDAGIARLPAAERDVVQMYYREGRRLADIAQIAKLHVSRVGQLKLQATERLRSFIEEFLKR